MNDPRFLILETSGRSGQVALATGATLLGVRRLDESRRNARDLAPAVQSLLDEAGWKPQEVSAVLVSRGPGSYTGLRVGVMSAKTFAYVTGAALIAVDTFAAVAHQTPAGFVRVDVLADAQKDNVYWQPYARQDALWQATAPLAIVPFAEWLAKRAPDAAVSGPGLVKWFPKVPAGVPVVEEALRDPQAASLLELGRRRYEAGERDDVLGLEPLYLRPSAAEEQWKALGRQ